MEEMGDPKYWLTQMRAPVQFAKSIATLAEQGVTHFVEIGPHPVLLGMGAECIPGAAAEWLPSLRRNRTDWSDLLESLQRLYVGGADVDWIGFDRDYPRRRVALPTYPFRRRRHWVDAVGKPAETATIKSLQMASDDHGDRARGRQGPGRRRSVKLPGQMGLPRAADQRTFFCRPARSRYIYANRANA